MFITINHIDDYCAVLDFFPGMTLTLRKDYENPYDDEAIAAYKNGSKVGYVANSVSTVCRGTYSAGRIYDRFDKEAECVVRFVSTEYGFLIAEIENDSIKRLISD
ncbi:MAG: HIRAN domain-containing protein [Clostridiales bacterium]|nr:HIRAN domain-containing protein [Clostridiales bacterium]MBR3344721.1 HIRAN domain-containing protein [Solobacterium sp.]